MLSNVCSGATEQRRNIRHGSTDVWDVLGWETTTISKYAPPDDAAFDTWLYIFPRLSNTSATDYPQFSVPSGTAEAIDAGLGLVWRVKIDTAFRANGGVDRVGGGNYNCLIVYSKVKNRQNHLQAWSYKAADGRYMHWPSVKFPRNFSVMIYVHGGGYSGYGNSATMDTAAEPYAWVPIWSEDTYSNRSNGYYKLIDNNYKIDAGSFQYQSSQYTYAHTYNAVVVIGIDSI